MHSSLECYVWFVPQLVLRTVGQAMQNSVRTMRAAAAPRRASGHCQREGNQDVRLFAIGKRATEHERSRAIPASAGTEPCCNARRHIDPSRRIARIVSGAATIPFVTGPFHLATTGNTYSGERRDDCQRRCRGVIDGMEIFGVDIAVAPVRTERFGSADGRGLERQFGFAME